MIVIQDFSEKAAPLHGLTQKNVCQTVFLILKQKLTLLHVVTYPQFHASARSINVGLGAVLEQDHYIIAYASCTLSKSEQNYSIIQKECLAIIYTTKQFRHYLLVRQLTLHTDHAPLHGYLVRERKAV